MKKTGDPIQKSITEDPKEVPIVRSDSDLNS